MSFTFFHVSFTFSKIKEIPCFLKITVVYFLPPNYFASLNNYPVPFPGSSFFISVPTYREISLGVEKLLR